MIGATVVPTTRVGILGMMMTSLASQGSDAQVQAFLRQVNPLLETAGHPGETAQIHDALTRCDEARLRELLAVLRRPPLIWALVPHAERLAEEAGFGEQVASLRKVPPFRDRVSFEDGRIQDAWERLLAGAAMLGDLGPALFDPVGQLAHGAIYLLDRQGERSWWFGARQNDPEALPPPSFGVLAHPSSERIARYNQDQNDGLGEVRFDFPPELRMAVVPSEFAPPLRERISLQYVMPTSEGLPTYFDVAWAKGLPEDAVIVTGIKGLLPDGTTPLEYLRGLLKEAKKPRVAVIDVLGYLPAARMIRERRAALKGEVPDSKSWDIVLASNSPLAAVKLAKRWVGPTATHGEEELPDGTRLVSYENGHFSPPLRITIVTDPELVRANELASIYKNLHAIHLGRSLFEKMHEYVRAARRGDQSLKRELSRFYDGLMEEAEKELGTIFALEGITPGKWHLLPEVRNDLFGSWGTEAFLEMYDLVWRIFHPHAVQNDWSEAMVLLKRRIQSYYSVRNPCYGFCLAADRAAALVGRSLSREVLAAAVARLRSRQTLKPGEPDPAIEDSPYAFFSMIPEGLSPEGLQVAEHLPRRYGRGRFRGLPKTFIETHLLIERMQGEGLLPPEVQRSIVELSRRMAQIIPSAALSHREAFLSGIRELRRHFESALRIFYSSLRTFPANGGERAERKNLKRAVLFVKELESGVGELLAAVQANSRLGSREISLLNQALLEAMTRANLFCILPPSEAAQTEMFFLRRRLTTATQYAKGEIEWEGLFPPGRAAIAADETVAHTLAVRDQVFQAIGPGLISLVHGMSTRVYEESAAVRKVTVERAAGQMKDALERARQAIAPEVGPDRFVFGVVQVVGEIVEELQRGPRRGKLNGWERLYVFQALIDTMIHARRYLTFPEERALVEAHYTVSRFKRIRDYLRGEGKGTAEDTPLWHSGSGRSSG